jgi:ATPase subunit of ABC transporter with duplicated ATPase domains
VVLFTAHDHEFVITVANRIVEIIPGGVIGRHMTFDEYIESTKVAQTRQGMIRKAA